MRLNEITNTYTIAVDMDGVLINFDAKASEVSGMNITTRTLDSMDKATQKIFWKRITDYCKTGQSFFGDMQLLPDAMELWRYISRYPHFILSAAGNRIPYADRDKRLCVQKYFGHNVKVEIVDSAAAKAKFAGPNVILIDDRPKSINPWIAAGGVGILHTNTA